MNLLTAPFVFRLGFHHIRVIPVVSVLGFGSVRGRWLLAWSLTDIQSLICGPFQTIGRALTHQVTLIWSYSFHNFPFSCYWSVVARFKLVTLLWRRGCRENDRVSLAGNAVSSTSSGSECPLCGYRCRRCSNQLVDIGVILRVPIEVFNCLKVDKITALKYFCNKCKHSKYKNSWRI